MKKDTTMEQIRNAKSAHYYVAALDVGATECRLAVQLFDAEGKKIDSAFVFVQEQLDIGEGFVNNTKVTTRIVTQVVGRMSSMLGFDVKRMAVVLMAGEAEAKKHMHNVRCTEEKAGTTSKIVTAESLRLIRNQAATWKQNEESNRGWTVVYNEPIRYYTKERNVERTRTDPEGTFTDWLYCDYLGIKVSTDYMDRFNTMLEESGIKLMKYYVEGLSSASLSKEVESYSDRYLCLHLGHSKSVLSEVFEKENGELQLSHYAWLPGVGTEFSAIFVKVDPDCTQEYASKLLQHCVRFDKMNYTEKELVDMAGKGIYENGEIAKSTLFAVEAVAAVASRVVRVLQDWYAKDRYSKTNFHIQLSGGIAGLAGFSKLLDTCFKLEKEDRVESIELPRDVMSYKVISGQNEEQVKEETLYNVLGVLRQEVARKELNLIVEVNKEEFSQEGEQEQENSDGSTRQGAEVAGGSQGESENKAGEGVIARIVAWLKKLFQGPSQPIV